MKVLSKIKHLKHFFQRSAILRPNSNHFPFTAFFFAFGLISTFNSLHSFDVDPVGKNIKDGVKNYKEGKFTNSLDQFQKAEPNIPEDKRLLYNKGTAYYKMGDYKSALKQFEKSASSAEDPELKAKSLYNMGNTHLKMGDKVSAIRSYLDAITVSPDFEAAKKNLDLLHKENEKQEKKEDPSNNENSQEKDESSNEKKANSSEQNKDSDQKPSSAPTQEKMKREEADRILDSARQDKIKRRKMQSKRADRNEIFW
jgi:tetratricopeptide (TPR) repeat protein